MPPSLLVEFRKRLNEEVLAEINKMIAAYNTPDDPTPPTDSDKDESDSNREFVQGTMILDATCAPQNIAYPQDTNRWNTETSGTRSHRTLHIHRIRTF